MCRQYFSVEKLFESDAEVSGKVRARCERYSLSRRAFVTVHFTVCGVEYGVSASAENNQDLFRELLMQAMAVGFYVEDKGESSYDITHSIHVKQVDIKRTGISKEARYNKKLTAEQVEVIVARHQPGYCPDTHYCFDWKAIADELNTVRECKLEETTSYQSERGTVHELECSECGHVCEHVNGNYEHCPHCTAKNTLF